MSQHRPQVSKAGFHKSVETYSSIDIIAVPNIMQSVNKTKTLLFSSVIWREREGYVSKCPELGVASCGSSVNEALKNLQEAVELYLENARALGMLDQIAAEFKYKERFTSVLEVVV